jgi:hypothetical protein
MAKARRPAATAATGGLLLVVDQAAPVRGEVGLVARQAFP